MAHTSEQAPKEGGHNSASTGTVGSTNAPAASTATRQSPQQAPTAANFTNQNLEQDDKEYNPSAEALIDDIDDERTLEEEEAMAGDNSTAVQNELDDLKRESEMPIEELLAYYQRMREQEDAQDGKEEEEEEEEEFDEEEDMEDEGEDEVRKKQSNIACVKDDGLSTQQSPGQQVAASNQSTQQTPVTTTSTAATPPQVNPSLSNSHLLSPPKPSQLNSQPRQNLADLKSLPTQDVKTNAVYSDGFQRPQQSNLAQHSQINLNPYNISAHPPAVQEQTIDIECVEDPRASFQISDAQPDGSSVTRHRRSMTEFLVDSGHTSSSMLKTFLDYDLEDSDDLDEDYSYTDDENIEDERDWRRVIHIGPEYQADVPENLAEYENDLPPYENQDTLVWACKPEQTKEELIAYLKRASAIPRRNDISISPASVPKISIHNMRLYREKIQDINGNKETHTTEANYENPPENLRDVYMSQSRKRLRIDSELEQENAMDGMNQYGDVGPDPVFNLIRDENSSVLSQDNRPEISTEEYFHGEEQLLFLLLQCNHNFEEALRRRRLDPFKYYISEPMSLWSQDECLGFEHGLRAYGKNFRLIRETKVPTRSRAEVVAFYYLWKKSERHDVYTTQYKLDRKRSLSHPGTTDYMDKFIEDNESVLNASSTHTPTPTESTVEANQVADVHHDVLMLSKCHNSESTAADCPTVSDDASKQNDTLDQMASGRESSVQDEQIYQDGNTSIQ